MCNAHPWCNAAPQKTEFGGLVASSLLGVYLLLLLPIVRTIIIADLDDLWAF
jgi:hypothetical protein